MKTFFKDLFSYNYQSNNKVIEVMQANADGLSEKSLQLISHIVSVHAIWNSKIKSETYSYERWDVYDINTCIEMNQRNYEDSTQILEAYDLMKSISYKFSTGQAFENSVSDLLYHVINHSNYHRAQIATEFRRIGIDPVMTDYILYKLK